MCVTPMKTTTHRPIKKFTGKTKNTSKEYWRKKHTKEYIILFSRIMDKVSLVLFSFFIYLILFFDVKKSILLITIKKHTKNHHHQFRDFFNDKYYY
jgi:hypothetical protein